MDSSVFNSSLIMIALRLFQRSVGLISTMILARVLVPDDFGIIAIVTMVGLFFNILTQTGGEQYIIQKSKVDDLDLDNAFTLDILTKLPIFLLFVLCVPFISTFYEIPELTSVLYVSSSIILFGAFVSPKMYLLKKAVKFKSFAYLEGTRKIISFSTVMGVLFFEQSYWAIVFGDVASIAVGVIGSYIIAPYWPRLKLNRFSQQWAFSKWMLLKGVFGFTRAQLDTILVSKIFNPAEVGFYYMSKHVAFIPSTDIVIPASEPILASLSEKNQDPTVFKKRFFMALTSISLVISPMAAFIFFFPHIVVNFLLGDKWVETYSIMSLLSVPVFLACINQILETSMISLAKVKILFFFDFLTMAILFTVLIAFHGNLLEKFVIVRSVTLVFFTVALLILLKKSVHFSYVEFCLYLLPGLLIAIASAYFMKVAYTFLFIPWIDFLLYGFSYVIFYTLILIIVVRRLASLDETYKDIVKFLDLKLSNAKGKFL